MSLDDDEKAQAEAAFLREMEEDHARRLARLAERESKAAARRAAGAADDRQVALTELREDVQARFYRERGYKQWTDSTGRTEWVPPEEYAWREKARGRRRRRGPVSEGPAWGPARLWPVYGAAAALAILLGVLLAR
jgi:hypothetical protein